MEENQDECTTEVDSKERRRGWMRGEEVEGVEHKGETRTGDGRGRGGGGDRHGNRRGAVKTKENRKERGASSPAVDHQGS